MSYAAGGLAAFQIWSGFQQADMTRRTSQLNQEIKNMNAEYAEMDAWEAEKFGYTQTARYQSVVDKTLSDQRAIMAAQNVDVSYGTAAELQSESRLQGFLNTLEIQNAARAKAKGLKIEASNLRLGADMGGLQAAMTASGQQTSGIIQGLTTGISAYNRS